MSLQILQMSEISTLPATNALSLSHSCFCIFVNIFLFLFSPTSYKITIIVPYMYRKHSLTFYPYFLSFYKCKLYFKTILLRKSTDLQKFGNSFFMLKKIKYLYNYGSLILHQKICKSANITGGKVIDSPVISQELCNQSNRENIILSHIFKQKKTFFYTDHSISFVSGKQSIILATISVLWKQQKQEFISQNHNQQKCCSVCGNALLS